MVNLLVFSDKAIARTSSFLFYVAIESSHLNLLKYLFVSTVLLSPTYTFSQNLQLSGHIYNEETNAPIPFAQINTKDKNLALSNDQGYYTLDMQQKDSTLSLFISALGFVSDTITINLNQSTNHKYNHRLSVTKLTTVIVESNHTNGQTFISPSIKRLKSLPVLLGQTDLMKSLTIFPGISSGREGLSAIYVRGGSDDQNLYLLDGSTIYNPGHLFGFLSVFNPSLVRSLQVHKDYIPAEFSKRLSSTVSVQTKQGNSVRRTRSREIGLLGFNYADVGRFRDTTTTYAGGLRFSHTAVATLGSLPTYVSGVSPLFFAGMYDLNFKVAKKMNNNRLLSGSIYLGDDIYGTIAKGDEENEEKRESIFRYGNKTMSLRYFHPSSSGYFWETLANFNTYGSSFMVREEFGADGTVITTDFENESQITELSFQQKASFSLPFADVKLGGEFRKRTIEPVRLQYMSREQRPRPERSIFQSSHISIFNDVMVPLGNNVSFLTGIRTEYFINDKDNYKKLSFDPRASLNFKLTDNSHISIAYFLVTQNIHSVNIVANGLPASIWIPANNSLTPERSETLSLSYKFNPGKSSYTIGGYFKKMKNLIFLPTQLFSQNDNDSWSNSLYKNGEGKSFGLEFYSEHTISNRWKTIVSGTFSTSLRSFNDISGGEDFPFDFDRPFDIYLYSKYAINSKWSLNTSFVLQSGLPTSISRGTALDINGTPGPIVTQYNGDRLPVYHRLDILLEKRTISKKRKSGTLKFGVYNAYGRANPLFLTYTASGNSMLNPATNTSEPFVTPRLQSGSLFRFFPILAYEVNY